jgi:hypothetical protein
MLNIILNYQEKTKLRELFRVNRQFKLLVLKRKSGVRILDKCIPNKVFMNIMQKSKTMISRFGIKANKL